MANIIQLLNNKIKSINKKIDLIQGAGSINLNTSEVSFNTILGEYSKTLKVKLGRKPESEWELVNSSTTTYQTQPSNLSEGVETISTATTSIKKVGYFDSVSNFIFEEYNLSKDPTEVIVKLTINSPNPQLIEITPNEITFDINNWDKEVELKFDLVSRIRYSTEYYDKVTITSEVVQGNAISYNDNVQYIDINVYSSNPREGYVKGREINSLEEFTHPVNYSEEKFITIEKFQIIGSIVNGYFSAFQTIQFGNEFFNRYDPNVLRVISQLAGVPPELIVIPGEVARFASPSSPPLENTNYAIVGLDGRVFQSEGNPEILNNIVEFPKKIKISISDKIYFDYDLSQFNTINSPPPVNSQANFGPLSNGVMEITVNQQFTADELIKILPNGDSSLYIYATLSDDNGNFTNIQSWCNVGFLLYRPFVLKPIIKHTKNIWDTNRGVITHIFIQRVDADIIQYLDSHSKYEKRSGYTTFDKDYYAPELYYKYLLNNSTNNFSKIFFKGLIYNSSTLSDLSDLIDPNVDIQPYYTSLEDIFPTITNKWLIHSETPFVRVDYQSNTGYIFLKKDLQNLKIMNKYSANIADVFKFDDTLKEEPVVRCNLDLIGKHNLKIIGFS